MEDLVKLLLIYGYNFQNNPGKIQKSEIVKRFY